MAVGDRKTLLTAEAAATIYDRKDNITDDNNTYDSTKNVSAKALAQLTDRVETLEAGGVGGSYTLPTADATTLGGIKVGAGLSIVNGVLSATVTESGVVSVIPQTETSYTTIYGQTTFDATYTVGHVFVYFNGIKLDSSEYTATNGTSVVLNSGCQAGDIINIIGYTNPTSTSTFYTKADIDLKYGNISTLLDLINGEVI